MTSKENRKIAYFSMEIALESGFPIYSGGLGILAGDTLRSAADLQIPIVGVTLTYNAGYFYQIIAPNGNQVERDVEWDFETNFIKLKEKVVLELQDKSITVEAWKYNILGRTGHLVPVILLDTDIPENEPWQRNLTHVLYDANRFQRVVQEMILGVCGYKMLEKLGYSQIEIYHLNEGHAAFLIFELLEKYKTLEEARKHCVFTTHTPVKAGLEEFDYTLVSDVFRNRLPENIREFAGKNNLNMTVLALNGSRYVNAVSKKHSEVSQQMFPNFKIDSITNGVHVGYWLSNYMRSFLNNELGRNWHYNIRTLDRALELDSYELWRVHLKAKRDLLNYERSHSWVLFDKRLLTIGFARRMAEYKRPLLIFKDLERLAKIAKNNIQFIFAGKAHPADVQSKSYIKSISDYSDYLWNSYKIGLVFLENYELELAKSLLSGVDVWLNTPRRYMEASGTSGMKAAINGVLNFSVLDGWWIEGYELSKKMAGWAIGPSPTDPSLKMSNDQSDADAFYEILENEILHTYKNNPNEWQERMKYSIQLGAYFNTNRMIEEYADKAYLIERQDLWKLKE
ncbi:MAG: alpha-glucan family phosphorylase [Candidatus Lokiarchaeota archaeon]|nr:alpha-glucan family phosphorylase [Candidatus Lokiarchaeota archaeon]